MKNKYLGVLFLKYRQFHILQTSFLLAKIQMLVTILFSSFNNDNAYTLLRILHSSRGTQTRAICIQRQRQLDFSYL